MTSLSVKTTKVERKQASQTGELCRHPLGQTQSEHKRLGGEELPIEAADLMSSSSSVDTLYWGRRVEAGRPGELESKVVRVVVYT